MIVVDGVSKVFTTNSNVVEALRDINLAVDEGEFVSLVGRSGCGKSTLLRIIAGLVPATEGSVTVEGQSVTKPRRDVAFMFQRPALLPWRNVLANVLLPVEVARGDRKAFAERAHELLALVGLTGFEKAMPRELSGGMQQRVSLCRALINDPKVLLMDEPFGALDALTREELSIEVQRICAETNKTVVLVTHSIEEAVFLGDNVVVMTPRPGRILDQVRISSSRPRSWASEEFNEELAHCGSRLRELLFQPSDVA